VSRRFFLFLSEFLVLSQAAPVATLPSALLCERFSLGASGVFSILIKRLPETDPLPARRVVLLLAQTSNGGI
jgi:hypothetical protein